MEVVPPTFLPTRNFVKKPAPFAEEHVPFSLKEWSETSDVSEGIKHSALDAFLSALTQHPDTGQYTAPLPWLENMDETEIPRQQSYSVPSRER